LNPDQIAALLQATLQALQTSQQLNLQLVAQIQREPAAAAAVAPATPAPPQRTLGDWLTEHERNLLDRGYKPQTIKNRRAILAHVRRLWGHRPITELRPQEVASALREFGAQRSSTARRVHMELRDVYAEAVAHGWAEHNPATHLKPPAHRVKRARLSLETWQSMRTLAHAGPQRWLESLLLLALVTGQRRADLAKARFDDIVTAPDGQQVLRVEQQKQAGKGYGARIELPLSLRLDAIGMSLADVIEHCRQSAKPGPTLLRKAGGGSIEESSLSTRFHECIRAVLGDGAHKMHQWPSLHEVRSLSARLYTAQGGDVQTLLGHKRAEMTAIYQDDRGLSAKEWKRLHVQPPAAQPTAADTPTCNSPP
jgi:enterobacteria phage integrase